MMQRIRDKGTTGKGKTDGGMAGVPVFLCQAGIALFLFLYFTRITPLIIFDSDDWIYLSAWRIPVPIWHGYEAARVTPEVLLPVSGWIGVHLFYPLTGDFVGAVTLGGAVLVTFFSAFLCWCAYLFARKRLCYGRFLSVIFELLFLALQFLIFRNRAGSRNLFTAADYCCVFFYTVSGMLNASVVLLMMGSRNFERDFLRYAVWKKGLFVLLVYAALFSNPFHSGILAVWCGLDVLLSLAAEVRKKTFQKGDHGKSACGTIHQGTRGKTLIGIVCREHFLHLLILAGWLTAVIFEANGGRADSVETGRTLDFPNAVRQFLALVRALSVPYLGITVVAAAALIVFRFRTRRMGAGRRSVSGATPGGTQDAPGGMQDAPEGMSGKLQGLPEERVAEEAREAPGIAGICGMVVINVIVLTIYLLLLNSVIGYMSRIDATWGIWFWCVLLTDILVISVLREKGVGCAGCRWPALAAAAVVIVLAVLPDGRYMASTRDPEGYAHSARISRFLCSQVVEAAGIPDVETDFYIPDYRGTELEWAISDGIGTNISYTLYQYGIITDIPKLRVVYDDSLNG